MARKPAAATVSFASVAGSCAPDQWLRSLNTFASQPGFGAGGLPAADHFEMFDDLNMDFQLFPNWDFFADPEGTPGFDIFKRALNRDGTPVTASLAACLWVLSGSLSTRTNVHLRGVMVLAQKNLSAILLEYPVLMHPVLRIPARNPKGKGRVSVPNAIAMTRFARLPMATDFGPSNTAENRAQLHSFANSTSMKLGWTTRTTGNTTGQIRHAIGKTAFSLAIEIDKVRPALIASLHELGKHRGPSARALRNAGFGPDSEPTRVVCPYLDDKREYADNGSNLYGSAYSESFFAACGVGLDRLGIRHTLVPEFLTVIRDRSRDSDGSLNSAFKSTMTSAAVTRMVGAFGESVSAADVAENLHRLVSGMVRSGMIGTPELGAEWVVKLLNRGGLPRTDPGHVVALLQALDTYGPNGAVTCESLISPGHSPDSIDRFAPHWIQGVRAHTASKVMTEVLDRELHTPNATPATHHVPARRMRSL